MKNKITAAVILVGLFISVLGMVTINEYGGYSKTVHYWWYWTGCVSGIIYAVGISRKY